MNYFDKDGKNIDSIDFSRTLDDCRFHGHKKNPYPSVLNSSFYDKNGNEITIKDWSTYIEDKNYRTVASDEMECHLISTIWDGINRDELNKEKKMIFETMILDKNNLTTKIYRYSTYNEALEGHKKQVEQYKK